MGWHVSDGRTTAQYAAWYCCGTAVTGLALSALGSYSDVLWVQTHQLVYVD